MRARPEDIASLLAEVARVDGPGERVDALSQRFLGRPYLTDPLVGSPDAPEQLVTRLDGFDCVTFAESVLALAAARTPEEFERELVEIRYHHGRVAWLHRNHYTSDWFARNMEAGRLTPVLGDLWVGVPRRLSVLAGYPVRETTVHWLPMDRIEALEREARTGDVVGFGSSRADLDTSHMGLLIRTGGGLLVRHASRSAGCVVEGPLSEFLARNQPPGLLVARPEARGGGAT